jgi:hypothetical protein
MQVRAAQPPVTQNICGSTACVTSIHVSTASGHSICKCCAWHISAHELHSSIQQQHTAPVHSASTQHQHTRLALGYQAPPRCQ